MPMDLRSAAYACQKVTNALTYIYRQMGYFSINYLDDFSLAKPADIAWNGFEALSVLFKQLGMAEAVDKAEPPSTRMEFLGVWFDTDNMTIEVSPTKLKEIQLELQIWQNKTTCTRKQLGSISGKLQFLSSCVRGNRLFLSRFLNYLRSFPRFGSHPINQEVRKDMYWWQTHMPNKMESPYYGWRIGLNQINLLALMLVLQVRGASQPINTTM